MLRHLYNRNAHKINKTIVEIAKQIATIFQFNWAQKILMIENEVNTSLENIITISVYLD